MREYFIRVFSDYSSLGLSIVIGYVDRDFNPPKIYVAQGKSFSEHREGEIYNPSLFLPEYNFDERQMAQQLVDKLVEHGIKPTIKLPDTNELTATKYHLEDLRKIMKIK
jgi:hypothetical protein